MGLHLAAFAELAFSLLTLFVLIVLGKFSSRAKWNNRNDWNNGDHRVEGANGDFLCILINLAGIVMENLPNRARCRCIYALNSCSEQIKSLQES